MSGTDAPAAGRHGRAEAVTAVTPIRRRGWALWLRVVFAFGRRTSLAVRPLRRLQVIALGRWYVLGGHTLVFETNWHGHRETYIDDFARLMPWQWRAIWSGDPAFPGPRPVTALLEYIAAHDHGAEHFWTAYPEASTAMVGGALELQAALERLRRETRGLGPAAFAERWAAFLDDHQRRL